MSVKRYTAHTNIDDFKSDWHEHKNGPMVKHEDFAALEQRLIESERYGRQTDITIDNLEMKLAQMAAENAGLKSEVPMGAIENGRAFADRLEAYPFECQGGNLNMCSDWQELRRCFEHLSEWAMHGQPETPATDAFLAEVRASELDSLAGVAETMLVKFANQNASQIPEAKGWEMIQRQASHRAAQLRKGVQS